jgi:hypothetical protein
MGTELKGMVGSLRSSRWSFSNERTWSSFKSSAWGCGVERPTSLGCCGCCCDRMEGSRALAAELWLDEVMEG